MLKFMILRHHRWFFIFIFGRVLKFTPSALFRALINIIFGDRNYFKAFIAYTIQISPQSLISLTLIAFQAIFS